MRDFKKAFVRELKKVLIIYPEAKVAVLGHGLELRPSLTHVKPTGNALAIRE